MFVSIASILALVATTSASPLAKRDFDPHSVCNDMYAQPGDCHFVMTSGMMVTLSGSPATGSSNAPGVGWSGGSGGGGVLYDSDCNEMGSGKFEPQNPGFKLEFKETKDHDWIEVRQDSMGFALSGIPIPYMKSGLNDPLAPICDEQRDWTEGLDAGIYRVCVFPCSGGLQIKE
ncbi:hypothetical protein LIA77_09113 [Sarocladium implicatum]|nr:hypothetical protein LIA77_09113 [Sarocladium implicatum]